MPDGFKIAFKMEGGGVISAAPLQSLEPGKAMGKEQKS
jgi:hypothetical protein